MQQVITNTNFQTESLDSSPRNYQSTLNQVNPLRSHYNQYQQRLNGPRGHFHDGYSQADSSSPGSSANRFTVHGYQFIEDYENISPRLIQTANVMHYNNSIARTSLIGQCQDYITSQMR